jgi:hypothetical protein
MPHGILQVVFIILHENVFQNPVIFRTPISLSPEQFTSVQSNFQKSKDHKTALNIIAIVVVVTISTLNLYSSTLYCNIWPQAKFT